MDYYNGILYNYEINLSNMHEIGLVSHPDVCIILLLYVGAHLVIGVIKRSITSWSR